METCKARPSLSRLPIAPHDDKPCYHPEKQAQTFSAVSSNEDRMEPAVSSEEDREEARGNRHFRFTYSDNVVRSAVRHPEYSARAGVSLRGFGPTYCRR